MLILLKEDLTFANKKGEVLQKCVDGGTHYNSTLNLFKMKNLFM